MGARLKATPQQLEALVRLRGNSDADQLWAIIGEYEHELLDRLAAGSDMPLLYRTQGGIEALRTLRSMFLTAPSVIEKLKK